VIATSIWQRSRIKVDPSEWYKSGQSDAQISQANIQVDASNNHRLQTTQYSGQSAFSQLHIHSQIRGQWRIKSHCFTLGIPKFAFAMQFGKLPSIEGLGLVNFELPASSFLLKAGQKERCAVRLGGTTWNIPQWVGSTYPAKTPRRLFPQAYGAQFGTIEFNATHYRIYAPDKMAAWAASTPEDFRFCPKFPQIITHFRRFKNCEGPTDDFIEGLLALGNRLGPSFIQLPPHYAPKHAEAMWTYLEKWPQELPVSVEFRHPDWFTGDGTHWERLAQLGVGAVISDTAGRRDALHMQVTAPHVLVRFGGYEGHEIDAARLAGWAHWIKEHEPKGLSSFHLLVHEPDSLHTPKTCQYFHAKLSPELQRACNVQGKSGSENAASLALF